MSEARSCDACGAVTSARRRQSHWVRVQLPAREEERTRRDLFDIGWGEHWDACSPSCLASLAGRWATEYAAGAQS